MLRPDLYRSNFLTVKLIVKNTTIIVRCPRKYDLNSLPSSIRRPQKRVHLHRRDPSKKWWTVKSALYFWRTTEIFSRGFLELLKFFPLRRNNGFPPYTVVILKTYYLIFNKYFKINFNIYKICFKFQLLNTWIQAAKMYRLLVGNRWTNYYHSNIQYLAYFLYLKIIPWSIIKYINIKQVLL